MLPPPRPCAPADPMPLRSPGLQGQELGGPLVGLGSPSLPTLPAGTPGGAGDPPPTSLTGQNSVGQKGLGAGS